MCQTAQGGSKSKRDVDRVCSSTLCVRRLREGVRVRETLTGCVALRYVSDGTGRE